jgi:hypothetical protein
MPKAHACFQISFSIHGECLIDINASHSSQLIPKNIPLVCMYAYRLLVPVYEVVDFYPIAFA